MDTNFLDTLFDHLPDGIYVLDPITSNIIYCNQVGYQSLQLEADEVLNHSVLTLQEDVSGLPAWTDIANAIRNTDVFTFLGSHRRKDGSEFPVEVNTSSFFHNDKEYFVSIARDITQRILDKNDILEREQQLWYVLNETSYGLWDWNIKTNEVYFSPRLKRMLGYGPNEMKADLATWADNIHPEDAKRVMRIITDHIEGKRERYEAEYRLKNRNGIYIWVHDNGKASEYNQSNQAERMVGMVQDITDRKTLELQLEENATIDMLTGIMNRREGEKTLEKQLELSNRLNIQLGICLFDIDHFKKVNDLHGHLIGDKVLKTIAEIVKNNIRKSDFFYRWGGEEFVLTFPNTTPELLSGMAESIRVAIETYRWSDEFNFKTMTASFGLAIYPDQGLTLDTLILNADTAMYEAKKQGRNRIVMADKKRILK